MRSDLTSSVTRVEAPVVHEPEAVVDFYAARFARQLDATVAP